MEEPSRESRALTIKDLLVDLSYPHDQCVISVSSVKTYTIIDEYRRGILMEEAKVNTKYKTVDKKIKLVAVPLPEDSWQKMKEVANDPSLRDPKTIVMNIDSKSSLRPLYIYISPRQTLDIKPLYKE